MSSYCRSLSTRCSASSPTWSRARSNARASRGTPTTGTCERMDLAISRGSALAFDAPVSDAPHLAAPVTARGLAKTFGATRVLHGLDLHVPAGQFLAVVGRSGC